MENFGVYIRINFLSVAANEEKQPASAILWVYYYMAQHYDYLQDTVEAFKYIETAINHTPTLIELFIVKGQIYKVLSYYFSFHSRNCPYYLFVTVFVSNSMLET